MVNGRGAQIDPASPLAREPYLAVAELTGSATAGRILLAAPITLAEIEARFADDIITSEDVTFDPASASLRMRRLRRLGAITLSEQPLPAVANDAAAHTLAKGVARLGVDRLPWTNALRQWRDRVLFLRRAEGGDWPDLSDTALAADVDWLAAIFAGKTSLAELSADEFAAALTARLPYPLQRRLDAEAPTHFEAPTGSRVPIDYEAEGGPEDRDPRPGAVRPRPPSRHRRWKDPAAGRASFAGAPSGTDDARSARLLARQLRGRPRGDARALSKASLAG